MSYQLRKLNKDTKKKKKNTMKYMYMANIFLSRISKHRWLKENQFK